MGIKNKKKATIYDVAEQAGVSPGTASRALNGTGYVRQETAEKVAHWAKALHYVPNNAARILKTLRTGLIGLAIPDTSNPIYFRMIEAVQEAARERGYSLLLFYTNGEAEEELRAVKLLRNNTIDGLFLIQFSNADALRSAIAEVAKPVVLCSMSSSEWAGNPENTFDTISIDVYKGVYGAVAYLIGLGHRDIAYLAGKPGISVYQQRFRAYRQALEDHGIPYSAQNVYWRSYDEETGQIAAADFLSRPDAPAAVCASNDLQAIGFYRGMLRGGRDPRERIHIVGVDDTEIMQVLDIPSVNIREEEVGRAAAELLFERLRDDNPRAEPKDLFVEPRLVTRE